ncbi:aldehyde dehydrogenase family protein [Limnohabitans sp. JirII-29]|uniref:aldehyde dehydrogenase family protein n=1 Tax=unclassified Limnohabitans TaxID=2626134 RepID=UPI000C1F3077|nr:MULTISPECIES: aldehyde dehydrogenase family protein [unclassified Limnohabitans]PIT80969.1 aldehyde dehydrogenase family protein [Limnohabitans sp. JirII-31]PUE28316.1 aldehyde dehydrogenase family protein [Limnohabitans sp. JirII-29]
MKHYDSHYINGQWVKAQSSKVFEVHDSSTEEVFATVPQGSRTEAEQAVMAARKAFDSWSQLAVETRCGYIDKIVEGLKARTDEMGTVIAREVGMPIKLAKMIQVGGPVFNWGNAAKVARRFVWEERVGNSLVVREPIGVVGCITPWNFPLNQITLKVAPALAAGCTVVLKPSEIAPVNAMLLAEIIHEAGLPPGVFNLVNGTGPEVGEVLASHPEVDMVSFTGSTRAGKRVGELAAQTVKRVALELGGKSASVILADADLEAAVKGSIGACLLNSGQTCSAHTRMLVPESKYEEVKKMAQAVVAKYTLGPSLDESTRLGPLVSAAQRDRVIDFIQLGLKEGAELVAGGSEKPKFASGYFVQPTVLRVKPTDTLAKEEIFGPVLVIITYKDEAEAIRIANDSVYGLGGGVWSADEAHATAVARRIRTGQVDINGAPFNGNAPFGGYKQSGNGRENGKYGFEEFLEYKALQFKPEPK